VAKQDAFDSVLALSRMRAVSYDANADESRYLVDPARAGQYRQAFLDKSQQVLQLDGASLATFRRHDVAHQLLDWMGEEHPDLVIDQAAVLFGAAAHDIGKVIHTGELSGPGSAHEQAGYRLLLDHRIDPAMARFARTHADWTGPGIVIEDLVVSLADKVWKAKRVPDLEQMITDHLATASRRQPWEAFMALDDFLTRLAEDVDRRLTFQARHPIIP
jgi:hypothetical protein